MASFGGISGEQLTQYIERIEGLEVEKTDIADNIRDVFAEAKANGFDPKVMRQLLKLRKMEESERDEQETVLDLYKAALGMIPEFESVTKSEVDTNTLAENQVSSDDVTKNIAEDVQAA